MGVDAWPRPEGGRPGGLFEVPYDSGAGPTSTEPASWLDGANCQRFGYGVLALFGLVCPPLRSFELWAEASETVPIDPPAPLDLVLFNADADPYGAHVAVLLAEGELLHLCREVAPPAVWSPEEFARRPRDATVVGAKRVRTRATTGRTGAVSSPGGGSG